MIDHYFATPIYRNTVDKETVDKILPIAKDLRQHRPDFKYDHWSTHDSSNTMRLHTDPKNEFIVDLLNEHVNNYVTNLKWQTNDYKIKLDKLWFNSYELTQVPREHYHPGAVISGVMYFGKGHNIRFHHPMYNVRPTHLFHQVWVDEENESNHSIVYYPVQEGMILLFPSYLIHSGELNNNRTGMCYTMAFDFIVESDVNHHFPSIS